MLFYDATIIALFVFIVVVLFSDSSYNSYNILIVLTIKMPVFLLLTMTLFNLL